jgi:hypothetical protein
LIRVAIAFNIIPGPVPITFIAPDHRILFVSPNRGLHGDFDHDGDHDHGHGENGGPGDTDAGALAKH